MRYFEVEPEVAGGLGDNTEIDHSTTPITVTRLHYEIETWAGSELLETFPVFVATEHFVDVAVDAGLTGFLTDDAEVTVSDQGRDYMATVHDVTDYPPFVWFRPVGVPGRDDFAIADRATLVVSERALDIIRPLLGDDVLIAVHAPGTVGAHASE